MASYSPAKKNAAFVMYVSLRSQADVRLFQVNPTLASGDVKVSKDGGALSNVATLPSVVSSSAVVKVELSSTEMNADNVTVLFSDAAGGQWCDLVLNIQTAGQQFDDLATASAVSTLTGYVDTEVAAILAAVDTEVAAIKAKTDNLPASPAAVGSAMTLAADAVDSSALAASAVSEIQSGLATASAVSTLTGYVDTEVTAILAAVDTEVAAIKAKTDNLPASPAAVGSAMTLADGAITSAKFATGAITAGVIGADAIGASELAADAVTEIQSGLATAAAVAALNDLSAAEVKTQVVNALTVDTYGEPGSVPAATSSLKDKLNWMFMMARNKRVTTGTQDKVRNDGDAGDVGTAALSDDGTSFTRGKYS